MTENFKIIATVKTLEQASIALSYPNTLLRINSSHMETPDLIKLISNINGKYPEAEIYIDLQGSKIRISRNQPKLTLKEGQKIKLTIEDPFPETTSIHIGNPNTIKLLVKGTKVRIDDGRIELIIDSIENEKNAIGTVTKEGILRPGKGFNLYPHPFVQNQLNKRDIEIVENCKNYKGIKFALSFVSVPEEILDLKRRANNKSVAAKIEREMSEDQVKAICQACDSIWICRGDMGVQMGFVGMTKFVREFTKKYIPNLKIPCIIAGEVMEHLCQHPSPTRTEICYLSNCILDGYKGMVLSDETVFGKYPKETMDFCYNYIFEFCKSNILKGNERVFFNERNKHFKSIEIKKEDDNIFKGCNNITVEKSSCNRKNNFWNCNNLNLINTTLAQDSNESIWNCKNINIINSDILGEKICRNCSNLSVKDSNIKSDEFCWKSDKIKLENNKIEAKSILLDSSNINIESSNINGDNSIQYANNIIIYNSNIKGDSFLWYSKNIYCKNCKLVGDRLGWYCENAIFEDCFIDSTHPLCYCKNLRLINCKMNNSSFAFEYSEIEGDIHSHIDFLRNILKGKIVIDSYGDYFIDDNTYQCKGVVEKRSTKPIYN